MDVIPILALVVGYPLLGVAVGYVAKRRGRSGGAWAALAMMVSAPVALLLLFGTERGPLGVAAAVAATFAAIFLLAQLIP